MVYDRSYVMPGPAVVLLAAACHVSGGHGPRMRDTHLVSKPAAHVRSVMLTRGENDDEEPSLALGADGSVYIIARRHDFRTVLWVSRNGGDTSGLRSPVT